MVNGKSVVLIGLQYGDEGKARVLDKIMGKTDIVARFNGGANAGHTLEVGDKKIALHQVPSGIFHDNMVLYMGSGCVINPLKLNKEVSDIESLGIKLKGRLRLSAKITLVQPHHVLLDSVHGGKIGTTKNGIGPAYSDQAARAHGENLRNLRLGDYAADPKKGLSIVLQNLKDTVKMYELDADPASLASEFDKEVRMIIGFCEKDPMYLEKQVRTGKNVFFEGAQSTMLDVVYGNVPFVTSSRTMAGAAYVGGDLSSKHHVKTVAVAKAIMSRVGNGPFISEFGGKKSEDYCAEDGGFAHMKESELAEHDQKKLLVSDDPFELGIALRMMGGEYGASTKRPRRLGILDLVMLRQNCMMNAVDELYINKFDCLVDFKKTKLPGIPVVTAYELDGNTIDYIPSTVDECYRAKPVVEYLPFIKDDLTKIRDKKDLPKEVFDVIRYIEDKVGTKMGGIGVGPERDQFVMLI